MSGNEWPHSGLWPILINEMNIIYNNETFNSFEYYQALMNGSNIGSSSEIAKQLKDYASKNLLKVHRTIIFMLILEFSDKIKLCLVHKNVKLNLQN